MKVEIDGRERSLNLRAKLAHGGRLVVCGRDGCGEEIGKVWEHADEHARAEHGDAITVRELVQRAGWKKVGTVWRRSSRWARGHRVHLEGRGDDVDRWSDFPTIVECPRPRPRDRHLNILDAATLRLGSFPSSER